MKLKAADVEDTLRKMGATALFHANTVATACTFLEEGQLLSRNRVEASRLIQTPQGSDSLDRKYRIWDSVFVDAVDIHARASRRNQYGPVLFILSLSALSRTPIDNVWITRSNPTNWHPGEARSARYFPSMKQFKAGYGLGDFGSMLILRDTDGALPLAGRLLRVILDDPGTPVSLPGLEFNVFPPALRALKNAAKIGGLKAISIEVRQCHDGCLCREEYRTCPVTTLHAFLP